ncbi:MAG: ATP-binding cassette domain-containing protein [Betaproteobacteria bacterium]|nr:ATP-binding cassette domain-containing protein [Betaproteobacteria bacterium]
MKLELHDACARHPAARPDAAPAIRSLSLSIAAGEQVAVIGPSGAGKTTLLQVIACALPPHEGRLTLGAADPWTLSRSELQRLRGRLFLAPQVPPLPPRQRVVTSVLAGRLPAQGLWASLRSLFYPSDIPSAFDALSRFDLADKLFDRVDRLSGGERQRVGLARALLSPASLWLVDEPLSALDPARSTLAIRTLVDTARERGITLVATLHQVDKALEHFPRVIGLRDGALAFDLPSAQVTRERLAQLYDQFEHELRGEAAAPMAPSFPDAPAPAAPAVMHCR